MSPLCFINCKQKEVKMGNKMLKLTSYGLDNRKNKRALKIEICKLLTQTQITNKSCVRLVYETKLRPILRRDRD